ncbi:MAG: hypothetical protein ABSA93_27280 [Streptosporangiaceae bacterium]|jgi:hypothetical protein
MANAIQRATGELRKRQRSPMLQVTLCDAGTQICSPDGMVTVTVDKRGEVSSIAFNVAEFGKMAPAELGAVLVQTISQARAGCRKRLFRVFAPFLLEGCLLRPGSGPDDLDEIFDDAARKADELMAEGSRESLTDLALASAPQGQLGEDERFSSCRVSHVIQSC